MKIPLMIFAMLLLLSCGKDINDCTLVCGEYDGTTKVTIKNAGTDGRDLVSKNPSIIHLEEQDGQFRIDNLLFTFDKDGEYEEYDTADGKEKVTIRWENNMLFIDEDFGNGRTSSYVGEKVD